MEMKKTKMSNEPRDRLSELHDSLIFNIFEFLPMKYIIRTQILSHRWKNLWTLTPFLYFKKQNGGDNKFRKFVNRALLSWRGTRVLKFKLSGIAVKYIRSYDDFKRKPNDGCKPSLFTDIVSWLRFAVDNGVEELDFSYGHNSVDFIKYCVPQFLYSCSSLKKLSLSGSIIEITRKAVQWNQLLTLTIKGRQVNPRAVEEILSGSPLLEIFNFYFEPSDDNVMLSIRSSSLKVLSIRKILGKCRSWPLMDTELRIWAPNLKSLRIKGMPYGMCVLENVSSLTHATLWFYGWYNEYFESYDCANDYLEGTLSRILPAIQHVEGLTLSDWCIQVLFSMNSKSLLSTFSNVKFLSLNGKFEEAEQMLGLLEFFPELQTLVFKEGRRYDVVRNLKFKWNPSMYFLDELRTVEVTWNQRNFSIFPLIQSLLEYARELEKMVFRFKEIEITSFAAATKSLIMASQKLRRMPRSSPTAELIIL